MAGLSGSKNLQLVVCTLPGDQLQVDRDLSCFVPLSDLEETKPILIKFVCDI